MTKETYRELEALAVEAIKGGLRSPDPASAMSGLQVLEVLHHIRYPAANLAVPVEESLE